MEIGDAERIRALEERNRVLEELVSELQKRVAVLEARLAKYENPHTPPSLRRGNRGGGSTCKPGQKEGHEGVTRPTPEPTETVEVKLDVCPKCKHRLGRPIGVKSRIIVEIPEPQPLRVIEYRLARYQCSRCKTKIIASHPDCPADSKFGLNTLAQVTILKYADRLPHRKVCEALERQFGLKIAPATVLDITRRVSGRLQQRYKRIIASIRRSSEVYVDETGMRVNGRDCWLWVFTAPRQTLFVIRKRRSKEVLEEILGKRYDGTIICDGLAAYSRYSDNLQRCWAHLLREIKHLAEEHKSAGIVFERLKKLYAAITGVKDRPPPLRKRIGIRGECIKEMEEIISRCRCYKELRRFGTKMENGLEQWFTCILKPEIEPTNNRAERALREMVVQRKIIGTLRNLKGTTITETIMTLLTTWKQQNLNPHHALIQALRH